MADRHRVAVWLRVLLLPVGVVAGFLVFQSPMRELEALLSADVLRLFGASANVPVVAGSTILVVPSHSSAFWVLVEPSCSSLASLLALIALACMLPPPRGGRSRVVSAATACLCVLVGNLIRISSSVAIGVLIGRPSLVLFHDWVGSVFGFGYTLAGFVLMLRMLLPPANRAGTDLPPAMAGESLTAVAGV